MSDSTTALVVGGTGFVGSAVVRALSAAGVDVRYTGCTRPAPHVVDLRAPPDPAPDGAPDVALDALLDVDALAVCSVRAPVSAAAETADDVRAGFEVNVLGVERLLRTYARVRASRGGSVVLCAAVDGVLSLASAPGFAASQAAVVQLVRSLSRAPGFCADARGHAVRINAAVFAVLGGGITAHIDPALLRDYLRFAASRQIGDVDEAAALVRHLLIEQTFATGAIVVASGGL